MSEIRNYDDPQQVAEAAAENAVEILSLAIESSGMAVWVLAGGTSPMLAYQIIVERYGEALDWSKVTVLIGDERMVSFDDQDSNWGAIMRIFETNPLFAEMRCIAPDTTLPAPEAAAYYAGLIQGMSIQAFDLVWVGVGEDGHTLSLFPGNPGFTEPVRSWVIPIHDSPKPPSERISLSLIAMEHVRELVIFAVGAAKKDALKTARLKGGLPIASLAETVEAHGGEVRWLYDDAAWEDS
jgi:6-phosphogluconolactonase